MKVSEAIAPLHPSVIGGPNMGAESMAAVVVTQSCFGTWDVCDKVLKFPYSVHYVRRVCTTLLIQCVLYIVHW